MYVNKIVTWIIKYINILFVLFLIYYNNLLLTTQVI